MKKRSFSERLRRFSYLPSTNEFCRDKDVKGGDIILAESQTRGRGRLGRSFFSEIGGVYISFCYEPKGISPSSLASITGMCAVAVIRALKEVCGIDADIKWLNDILFRGKKICGILAETILGDDQSVEKLIIGIGINLNQESEAFPPELRNIASSVRAETHRSYDAEKLIFCLAGEMDKAYDALVFGKDEVLSYVDEYKSSCIVIGKKIHILTPSLAECDEDVRETYKKAPHIFPTATAVGIDKDFCLVVEKENGEIQTLFAGEISIR